MWMIAPIPPQLSLILTVLLFYQNNYIVLALYWIVVQSLLSAWVVVVVVEPVSHFEVTVLWHSTVVYRWHITAAHRHDALLLPLLQTNPGCQAFVSASCVFAWCCCESIKCDICQTAFLIGGFDKTLLSYLCDIDISSDAFFVLSLHRCFLNGTVNFHRLYSLLLFHFRETRC